MKILSIKSFNDLASLAMKSEQVQKGIRKLTDFEIDDVFGAAGDTYIAGGAAMMAAGALAIAAAPTLPVILVGGAVIFVGAYMTSYGFGFNAAVVSA